MIMSLGITANRKKNGTLLAYIANKVPNINLRKLLKITYLIDEKFMKLRGFPLTWFDYYVWAKGPVAPEVYDIKNGAFSEYVTCHKNTDNKNIVEPVLSSKYLVLKQMDMFSPYEMKYINDTIFKYSDKTADELTALTHREDSLWAMVINGNSINFINGKSEVLIPLTLLNKDSKEKNEVYEDAKWNMQFQAALNSYNIK